MLRRYRKGEYQDFVSAEMLPCFVEGQHRCDWELQQPARHPHRGVDRTAAKVGRRAFSDVGALASHTREKCVFWPAPDELEIGLVAALISMSTNFPRHHAVGKRPRHTAETFGGLLGHAIPCGDCHVLLSREEITVDYNALL